MASEPDFESRTIYEISLAVTDSPINGRLLDNQSRVVIEILDVDDNPPQLSSSLQNVTIVIDETDSGEIYSIDSSDINDFDTYPENREYIISIDTIRPVKFNRFLINRMTENDKWSILASDGLDGFGDEEIEVTIKISSKNKPQLSTTSIIIFKIIDVNNNFPTLIYDGKAFSGLSNRNIIDGISYNENENSESILTLRYEDDDKNENARVVFSVDHNNIDYTTRLNTITLKFKQPPDYEAEPIIRVKLTAEDRPLRSDEKKVTIVDFIINIIDVDDNEPYFSQVGMPLLILYRSIKEETLDLVNLDLNLFDDDTDANQDNEVFFITDTLQQNQTIFDILKKNNSFYLNVTNALDYEEIKHIEITIGCKQDKGLSVFNFIVT